MKLYYCFPVLLVSTELFGQQKLRRARPPATDDTVVFIVGLILAILSTPVENSPFGRSKIPHPKGLRPLSDAVFPLAPFPSS